MNKPYVLSSLIKNALPELQYELYIGLPTKSEHSDRLAPDKYHGVVLLEEALCENWGWPVGNGYRHRSGGMFSSKEECLKCGIVELTNQLGKVRPKPTYDLSQDIVYLDLFPQNVGKRMPFVSVHLDKMWLPKPVFSLIIGLPNEKPNQLAKDYWLPEDQFLVGATTINGRWGQRTLSNDSNYQYRELGSIVWQTREEALQGGIDLLLQTYSKKETEYDYTQDVIFVDL